MSDLLGGVFGSRYIATCPACKEELGLEAAEVEKGTYVCPQCGQEQPVPREVQEGHRRDVGERARKEQEKERRTVDRQRLHQEREEQRRREKQRREEEGARAAQEAERRAQQMAAEAREQSLRLERQRAEVGPEYPAIRLLAAVYNVLGFLSFLAAGVLLVCLLSPDVFRDEKLLGVLLVVGLAFIGLLQCASGNLLELAANVAEDVHKTRAMLQKRVEQPPAEPGA
jgi:predicted RNA-binding Zn-ribbon protein involved in translation (DUF1610 family)